MRLATLALSLTVAVVANAADTVVLNCSGGFWTKGQTALLPVPNQSLVINSAHGTVTGNFGTLSISNTTENEISLKGIAKNGGEVSDSLDRYSGFTVISTSQGNEIIATYHLTCKRATPLF